MANDRQISEDYASPNLRWALCLEDHPGADWKARLVQGSELDVPIGWGGDEDFCAVTITFADGTAPVTGWKAVNEELVTERWVGKDECTCDPRKGVRHRETVVLDPGPELWNKLSTKTLGRALKRAGYPDDMPELKALLAWRKRLAEIANPLAIGSGPDADHELEAAAKPTPDHVGHDDIVQPESVTETLESVEPDEGQQEADPPTDLQMAEMRRSLGHLGRNGQAVIAGWAREEGIAWPRPATIGDVQRVVERIHLVAASVHTTSPEDDGGGYG